MKEKVLTIIMFCLCLGTLFLSTPLFVNAQITPKWYFAIFMGMLLALTAIAFWFCRKNQKLQYKYLFQHFCFLLTILCAIQVVYGLLQYYGVFTGNNGFQITGSFDNPAGFAACLCAGFPCVLFFFFNRNTWLKRIAYLAMAIIVWTVFFSGSRAGIVAIILVAILNAFYRFRYQTRMARKNLLLATSMALLIFGLYFLKKDSADGRLLIWRCSWEMIKDKPLLGHGYGGFKAGYMNYQAKYFTQNPDSQYTMLADNVNRPFNEYMEIAANYGLVGLLVLFVIGWFIWKSYLRCKNDIQTHIAFCCLLSVAVYAFFSYPLRYPFVWVLMIWSIAVIIYKAKYPVKIPGVVIYPTIVLMIPAIIFSGVATYQHMADEMLWCKTANQSLAGKTEQMLPVYEQLHPSLAKNELFLYNYAAELNVAGHYAASVQIAQECEQLWADYDLQMLLADNYENLQEYENAERHYKTAAAMCPVKFMPLYRLAKLYDATGDKSRAQASAKIILEKRIKIPSYTINAIRQEMKRLIEKDSTNASNNTLQDILSEQQTPEELLPP